MSIFYELEFESEAPAPEPTSFDHPTTFSYVIPDWEHNSPCTQIDIDNSITLYNAFNARSLFRCTEASPWEAAESTDLTTTEIERAWTVLTSLGCVRIDRSKNSPHNKIVEHSPLDVIDKYRVEESPLEDDLAAAMVKRFEEMTLEVAAVRAQNNALLRRIAELEDQIVHATVVRNETQ